MQMNYLSKPRVQLVLKSTAVYRLAAMNQIAMHGTIDHMGLPHCQIFWRRFVTIASDEGNFELRSRQTIHPMSAASVPTRPIHAAEFKR
jgi:hypothetical protein